MDTRAVITAAEAFLGTMRREHAKRFPDVENRVPALTNLAIADKASLIRAIHAACTAGRTEVERQKEASQ